MDTTNDPNEQLNRLARLSQAKDSEERDELVQLRRLATEYHVIKTDHEVLEDRIRVLELELEERENCEKQLNEE